MQWKVLLITLLLISASPASAATKTPACVNHTGQMHCFAKIAKDASGHPLVSSNPFGFGPYDWRKAYGPPGLAAARVGIVVAYGDPVLASDLGRYSSSFGIPNLPPCSSSAQSSCLDLRTQTGAVGVIGSDSGWATETALDAETVHGLCPRCRIEVVAAASASISDLLTAVDQAVTLGSTIVSMSWGGREFITETELESHFTRPDITFIASSGDGGYGTSWPAVSPHILAVGGTSLSFAGSIAHETAWSGSGSGCSRYEAKPVWQLDTPCKNRSMADISADADPATGAAVYHGAWYRVGGTSLAAPIIAGFAATHGGVSLPRVYALARQLRDIETGTNGNCSQIKAYLCRSRVGYDGPTGLGSLTAQFGW